MASRLGGVQHCRCCCRQHAQASPGARTASPPPPPPLPLQLSTQHGSMTNDMTHLCACRMASAALVPLSNAARPGMRYGSRAWMLRPVGSTPGAAGSREAGG